MYLEKPCVLVSNAHAVKNNHIHWPGSLDIILPPMSSQVKQRGKLCSLISQALPIPQDRSLQSVIPKAFDAPI